MSKETIEEFIEREGYRDGSTNDIWENGVREGAAWQAERMYSEEEVKSILLKTDRFLRADLEIWFEQFKKQKP